MDVLTDLPPGYGDVYPSVPRTQRLATAFGSSIETLGRVMAAPFLAASVGFLLLLALILVFLYGDYT
jgi:hypothetical protein